MLQPHVGATRGPTSTCLGFSTVVNKLIQAASVHSLGESPLAQAVRSGRHKRGKARQLVS